MTHRWPGRLSRSTARAEAVADIRSDTVRSFLDMDTRQSIAAGGVHALEKLGRAEDALRERWRRVEEQCFAAGATYLAATERPESDASEEAWSAFAAAIAQLAAASAAVDEFYGAYRGRLEHAVAEYAAVPRLAADARRTAQDAAGRVDGSQPYHRFPSVRRALGEVDAALTALARAEATGLGPDVVAAAACTREAADALRSTLADAPGRADAAAKALASVRTRLQAVGTRAENIAPAYSALLREFVAAGSADLTGARERCEEHMRAAAADIDAATVAARQGDPEGALDHIGVARQHLADAEEDVDAVTDRLARLREVRDHPDRVEQGVRFRLRDAQLLVVDRGRVAEWGSVLDAQLARLERAGDRLAVGRPDYWAYLRELDAIDAFVAGVIDRVRGRRT
ncbi:hypothetical protein [Rhodococcoides corynebacterioides]|uniref:hypothetical protein n=1 Tax=Rhodococcoides corynebacterioides TaxID=53972 RepID=UPI0027DEF89F|nr:hypothetical protein [Rhodococcus corynebacterioides]